MPPSNEKIHYFSVNKLFWKWKLHDGPDGCKIIPDLMLSLDKSPPPLPEKYKPKIVDRKFESASRKRDSLDKMVDDLERMGKALGRFQAWLNTPNSPAPAIVKLEKSAPVQSFDIREIPDAMRKLYLPVSAALMERWFAGELNYSPSSEDEAAEINQNGLPYSPEMYDMTSVKLDWVLRFPRAKEQFDSLVNESIRSRNSRRELYKKLLPYKDRVTRLDTEDVCGANMHDLHRRFQFQFASVDSAFSQKIGTQLSAQFRNNGVPDDLSGALGSFNFYAALGSARFSWDVETRSTTAEVTGVWVYVKDNYTFTDLVGEVSQYLGHWSSDGIIVVPYSAISAYSNSQYIPYVRYAVSKGNPLVKGNVYFPIHNSDFRRWALMHHRGGDFVIYSDRRYVPVSPPIIIPM